MTVNITLRLDERSILRQVSSPSGPVAGEMRRRGQRVLNAARRACPVDEGRLRGSLTLTVENSVKGPVAKVGSNLPYARYVHDGTGIYNGGGYIYPKRGRYLRWPVKNNSGGRRRYKGGATGKYAYAKRVRGMKGRPFLTDALKAASD